MTSKRRFLAIGVVFFTLGAAVLSGQDDGTTPATQPAASPETRPATAVPSETGAATQPSAAASRYAAVTANRVRVRGAPADSAPALLTLERGDVVLVTRNLGAWCEVRVPGGFPVFVRKGINDKAYVEVKSPGEGVVLVNDLLLRTQPTLEAANLGKVHTGTPLIILDEMDGWYKVLAPERETLFVATSTLKVGDDQESLARDFSITHSSRTGTIREDNEKARKEAERLRDLKKWDEKLNSLDQRYVRALKTLDDQGEWAAVRLEYEKFVEECPAESSARAKAADKAVAAKARENEALRLREADEKIRSLETRITEQNEKYIRSLEDYRNTKANTPPPPKRRYVDFGIGHVRKDILSEFGEQPVYTLEKGGQRHFFLTSERYNLDDYISKSIGVVEGVISNPEAKSIRTLVITRLEILD